ncbi:MAG: hypothetical protein R3B70_24125 [Polyangiaceae bacterium]
MSSLLGVAARALRTARTPQTMIAAVLAWSITVAPAAFARGAAPASRVCAVLALLCGVGGPLFLAERRRIGRHLGITAFLALALGAWLFSLPSLHPVRMSPFRAAIGSLAWAIFALSWREVWPKPDDARKDDPAAGALPPRASLPFLSIPILTFAIVGALLLVLAAFRTREPERGLVAQAIAVACGVGLVTTAATIATSLGKDRSSSGRRFTPVVIRALFVLVSVAVGGALYILLRT